MDEDPAWSELVLDWDNEQVPESDSVTGSVVEFAFGPVERSYLATSYPYRAEYAKKDKRKVVQQRMPPAVLAKIAHLQPRYIMNLAFRPGTTTWFIFCYRTRFAYDAKWEPRKPSQKDSIGETLDAWRTEAKDQVSSCAFGESSDIWFMRSTDTATEWYPELGPGAPRKLSVEFHKAYKRQEAKFKRNGEPVPFTKLRAVTFGHGRTWILYSKDTFKWSEHGLPDTLVLALTIGLTNRWTINKAVLNPSNPREYVLVYDHGPVYCSFHVDFQEPFKKILKEWSNGMRESGRHKTHDYEHDYHWEDPNEAKFASINDTASDVEDSTDTTPKDAANLSPQSNIRRTESRDRELETRSARIPLDSDKTQQPRPSGLFSRHSMHSPESPSNLMVDGTGISTEGLPAHGGGMEMEHNGPSRTDIEYQHVMAKEAQALEEYQQMQQYRRFMEWNRNASLGMQPTYAPTQLFPQRPTGYAYNPIYPPLPFNNPRSPDSASQYMAFGLQQQLMSQPQGFATPRSQLQSERDEDQGLNLRTNQRQNTNPYTQKQHESRASDEERDQSRKPTQRKPPSAHVQEQPETPVPNSPSNDQTRRHALKSLIFGAKADKEPKNSNAASKR